MAEAHVRERVPTPILMYHSLLPPGATGDRFAVGARAFRDQLALLEDEGLTVADLAGWWGGPHPAPTRAVVVTFDDGSRSDYELAFPLLREHSARGTFFVNPATVGEAGRITWAEAREMSDSGQAIESHSHDHVALSLLDPSRLAEQLRRSRQTIQDRLGKPASFLAVPYGLVNRRVVDAALQEGFRAVCTSRPWPAEPGLSLIPRIAIQANTEGSEFRAIVQGQTAPYLRRLLRSGLLYLPRQVLLRVRPAMLGVRTLEGAA